MPLRLPRKAKGDVDQARIVGSGGEAAKTEAPADESVAPYRIPSDLATCAAAAQRFRKEPSLSSTSGLAGVLTLVSKAEDGVYGLF